MSYVAFQPWVGRRSGRRSRWGVSVLLLGYSHYHEFKEVAHADYTRHVVGRHVRGINDRSRYWTKLARTFERRRRRFRHASPTLTPQSAVLGGDARKDLRDSLSREQ